MTTTFFQCDKEKTLQIMRNIIQLLKPDQICINNGFDIESFYGDEELDGVISHRHKIRVVELYIDLDDLDESSYNIDNESIAFYKTIKDQKYNISDSIEIHHGSTINNDEISLVAYLHETQAECDVSYPKFTYDTQYNCWIIKDDFWGAKNGISNNGIVTILDFSLEI